MKLDVNNVRTIKWGVSCFGSIKELQKHKNKRYIPKNPMAREDFFAKALVISPIHFIAKKMSAIDYD